MKESQEPYILNQKSSKRRMTTDCNYSVLSTLLMRFLKEKDKQAYKLSRELAKRNKISEEKNYSIIFLKIAIYLHRKTQQNLDRWEVVQDLFEWLQKQVDDCVNSKYKDNIEEFKKSIKKRNRQILAVIKMVFEEGDLGNRQSIKQLVINIYEKKGKEYSKTHEKMASSLANLIVGIISQGEQYQEEEEFKKQKKSSKASGASTECSAYGCSNPPDLSSTLADSSLKSMECLESLCSEHELNIFGSRPNQYCLEDSAPMLDLNFFENQNQVSFIMELESPENSLFI